MLTLTLTSRHRVVVKIGYVRNASGRKITWTTRSTHRRHYIPRYIMYKRRPRHVRVYIYIILYRHSLLLLLLLLWLGHTHDGRWSYRTRVFIIIIIIAELRNAIGTGTGVCVCVCVCDTRRKKPARCSVDTYNTRAPLTGQTGKQRARNSSRPAALLSYYIIGICIVVRCVHTSIRFRAYLHVQEYY